MSKLPTVTKASDPVADETTEKRDAALKSALDAIDESFKGAVLAINEAGKSNVLAIDKAGENAVAEINALLAEPVTAPDVETIEPDAFDTFDEKLPPEFEEAASRGEELTALDDELRANGLSIAKLLKSVAANHFGIHLD